MAIALGAIAALAGCVVDASHRSDPSESAPAALAPTPAVRGRVEALRERVGIRDSTAVFEPSGMESVRALIPPEPKHGVARTASVELPRDATGFATVEDDASQLSVRFALRDAEDAPIAVADGMAIYAGALVGADVVHRPHAEGDGGLHRVRDATRGGGAQLHRRRVARGRPPARR